MLHRTIHLACHRLANDPVQVKNPKAAVARNSERISLKPQLKKRPDIGMYGISRVDDPAHRTHAWRVSLRRKGKALVKNFPDKKWGGKRKALQLAKQYRDELLVKYPPISRIEFASTRRRNNTSGVTGVCLVTCKYRLANGAERRAMYWEAIWPTVPGGHINKRFSVATYGKEKAFELAHMARRKGLRKVEGVFWAAERGLIKTRP
jgi:hypothetical protein